MATVFSGIHELVGSQKQFYSCDQFDRSLGQISVIRTANLCMIITFKTHFQDFFFHHSFLKRNDLKLLLQKEKNNSKSPESGVLMIGVLNYMNREEYTYLNNFLPGL